MELEIFVRDWSEILKSLDSESTMMFSVNLMCWEYRDASLLTIFQPKHCVTVSWPSSFTGLKNYLYIHLRALEISVKSRTWDTCPSCWIAM